MGRGDALQAPDGGVLQAQVLGAHKAPVEGVHLRDGHLRGRALQVLLLQLLWQMEETCKM